MPRGVAGRPSTTAQTVRIYKATKCFKEFIIDLAYTLKEKRRTTYIVNVAFSALRKLSPRRKKKASLIYSAEGMDAAYDECASYGERRREGALSIISGVNYRVSYLVRQRRAEVIIHVEE